MPLLSANLNIMEKACKKASKLLIRDFGEVEKLQVSKKGPGDFVTNSDKRTEKIIINELSLARPDYSFLAEESGASGKSTEFKWIIDPIDGTTNFLHGVPYFAISIGLEKNKEIICGMIFNPITNEMFYAEKGKGAYLNNSRIRVSSRKNLRKFFEVNKEFIVYSTLSTLVKEQKIASKVATDAMKKYNIDPKKPIPTKL